MLRVINKIKRKLKLYLPVDSLLHRGLKFFYNKIVFKIERRAWANARTKGFTDHASLHMCSLIPARTLDLIIAHYRPSKWLDAGCGTGAALEYVSRKSIQALGLEYSDMAISQSGISGLIRRHDLTKPLDMQQVFDVVWCYEVAEHLPESGADQLVETLVKHGRVVVISAATPGQGGDGHINEQPKSYWEAKFKALGCILDKEITEKLNCLNELYSRNLLCFKNPRIQ